ncbi:hypothetical protein COMA1_10601 [Candidatus Nitrospira nitrosa]|uniref:Uncharacterized protein n=1 Tax=Candidatus Nitrospira nitrosa TaxID=1742972 RepID=A0A0S4L6M3_9BACT|nr:hypothetical protein COMA1_10601 [Candidatus Nitrospira nitrosa]
MTYEQSDHTPSSVVVVCFRDGEEGGASVKFSAVSQTRLVSLVSVVQFK